MLIVRWSSLLTDITNLHVILSVLFIERQIECLVQFLTKKMLHISQACIDETWQIIQKDS